MKFELQYTGFNHLRHMIKTLYINGKETKYFFAKADDDDTFGMIGDGDYPRFYNTIKHLPALDLPDGIFISFYSVKGKLKNSLHYGEMTLFDFIKYKTFFEVGLSITFRYKTTVNDDINPLKLLKLCNKYAKGAGFKKTEILFKESEHWFNMFSGTFYYRSKNNEKLLEEKLIEAITAFNKLLDKAAAEIYQGIKKKLKKV